MKNLFTTQTFITCVLIFYTQLANKALDEWVSTGKVSDQTARDLAERTFYTALIAYARYKGDKSVYTPRNLPGRDKNELLRKVDNLLSK